MTDMTHPIAVEVASGLRKFTSRLQRFDEQVVVEVTFRVKLVRDPGSPRDSYGGPIPPSDELESVELFGVDLLQHMSKAQQEQMIRALNGEEATL